MGRLLSFLLLGLLLYNAMGYSIVYLLEEHAIPTLADPDRIERSPSSRDIVLKVPVSLPYQMNWSHPEPTEGKIEHAGEYYQARTQQLVNDTIYVYCEYDQNARDRYMALVDHIQDQTSQPLPASHAKLLKSFAKEFMSFTRGHRFYIMEWIEAPSQVADQYLGSAGQSYSDIVPPPPDRFLLA